MKCGRVSSVNQIFISSSNEIGAFESGVSSQTNGNGAIGSFRRMYDALGCKWYGVVCEKIAQDEIVKNAPLAVTSRRGANSNKTNFLLKS